MLISVEGCVGAGKSTFAKGLAAYRTRKTLLEKFEQNPFLAAFYEDPVSNAVETEFTFLLLHFHHLKQCAEDLAKQELIADFHLGKDVIYAELNLPSEALCIFKDLYDLLVRQIASPTLMICLSASTELLVERIQQRSRETEQKIDTSYFGSVNDAYEKFFGVYEGRKLRISMDEWDFIKTPSLFEKLSQLVDAELKTS